MCLHPAPGASHRNVLGHVGAAWRGDAPLESGLPGGPSPVTSGPVGSSETPVSHPKSPLSSVVFLQKHSEKCFGKMIPFWVSIGHSTSVASDTLVGLKQWFSSRSETLGTAGEEGQVGGLSAPIPASFSSNHLGKINFEKE